VIGGHWTWINSAASLFKAGSNMAVMVLRLGPALSRRYWTGIQSGASVGYIKIHFASLSPHSVVSLLHPPHSHGVSRLTLSLCNKHQRSLTYQEAH
jgi:hypothetical protein